MNILLIEPDTVLAQAYMVALEAVGKVYWAKGAQTAVSIADKHTPDVIVLEPQLSRHNGVEFLYEFRSYQEWRHVQIIILTNSDIPGLVGENAKTLGIVMVLSKLQTSIQELAAAVRAAAKAPKA